MKRVLVTGAAGFVGRHCLPILLTHGFEVHGVSRQPRAPVAGVTLHRCDLLDDGATAALIEAVRPTHLLHLAWYAVPDRFWRAPENLDWAAATLRIARRFAAAGGRRLVVAGTCAEYDWSSDDTLSETTTPLVPRTLYGTAKNATRACLESAAPALGLEWAWGRVFFVYGPGESRGRLVPDLISGILAGRRVAVTAGTQIRDFLHVSDVARAFALLTDASTTGTVNIGSGSGVPLRRVIDAIAEETGGASLVDHGARPMTTEEPARLVADIGRLRDLLGFHPRIDLATGLARTVAWWRRDGQPE